jgi:large subunit ribosomal protein L22
VDPDGLFVKSCFVDMGPTKGRKRMRPAPQGRAYREQRHYCHITIEVSSDQVEVKPKKSKKSAEAAEAPAKKAPAKKAAAKKAEPKAKPAETEAVSEEKEQSE